LLGTIWLLAALRAVVNLLYSLWGYSPFSGAGLVIYVTWTLSLDILVPICECVVLTIAALSLFAMRRPKEWLGLPANSVGVLGGLVSVALWFVTIFATIFGTPDAWRH